jgi:hypothetical protein
MSGSIGPPFREIISLRSTESQLVRRQQNPVFNNIRVTFPPRGKLVLQGWTWSLRGIVHPFVQPLDENSVMLSKKSEQKVLTTGG